MSSSSSSSAHGESGTGLAGVGSVSQYGDIGGRWGLEALGVMLQRVETGGEGC